MIVFYEGELAMEFLIGIAAFLFWGLIVLGLLGAALVITGFIVGFISEIVRKI